MARGVYTERSYKSGLAWTSGDFGILPRTVAHSVALFSWSGQLSQLGKVAKRQGLGLAITCRPTPGGAAGLTPEREP